MSRPDEPDAVTLAIAGAVQRRLLGGLDVAVLPGVVAVRVHATGALTTGVVVEMAGGTNRFYLLRLVAFTPARPQTGRPARQGRA